MTTAPVPWEFGMPGTSPQFLVAHPSVPAPIEPIYHPGRTS